TFPAGPFLERSNAAMPGFRLVGGLAGAGGPGANRLFADGEVVEGGGVGVVLSGDVQVRTVVSKGCRPIGPAMVVTRAEGDVVQVGQTVRFQVRDAAGAGEDLTELLDGAAHPARGALLFSCNGRGTTMFPSADHDVRTVRDALGARVAGFFAAGEIGPVAG